MLIHPSIPLLMFTGSAWSPRLFMQTTMPVPEWTAVQGSQATVVAVALHVQKSVSLSLQIFKGFDKSDSLATSSFVQQMRHHSRYGFCFCACRSSRGVRPLVAA